MNIRTLFMLLSIGFVHAGTGEEPVRHEALGGSAAGGSASLRGMLRPIDDAIRDNDFYALANIAVRDKNDSNRIRACDRLQTNDPHDGHRKVYNVLKHVYFVPDGELNELPMVDPEKFNRMFNGDPSRLIAAWQVFLDLLERSNRTREVLFNKNWLSSVFENVRRVHDEEPEFQQLSDAWRTAANGIISDPGFGALVNRLGDVRLQVDRYGRDLRVRVEDRKQAIVGPWHQQLARGYGHQNTRLGLGALAALTLLVRYWVPGGNSVRQRLTVARDKRQTSFDALCLAARDCDVACADALVKAGPAHEQKIAQLLKDAVCEKQVSSLYQTYTDAHEAVLRLEHVGRLMNRLATVFGLGALGSFLVSRTTWGAPISDDNRQTLRTFDSFPGGNGQQAMERLDALEDALGNA